MLKLLLLSFQQTLTVGRTVINFKFCYFILNSRVPCYTSPLPVVFFGVISSLASGTIDILIAATSTDILLTLSWINVRHTIYFIFMALYFLL